MTATNLMCGDWVMFEKISFQETPEYLNGQVSKIDSELDVIYIKGKSCCYLEQQIKPIPLTQEILEKNGFVRVEKSEFNQFGSWNLEKYACSVRELRTTLFDTIICGYPRVIQYVHELQHVLKFCKIDKEIVL